MEDWMAYVPTRSLERGCDYFESGCVRAVEHRADGWHATVSGGSDYAVFVPASLDPREAQCTCPHYADGNICKHIVATFIAVERQRNADEEGGDFIADRFSQDAEFAPGMMELADERQGSLPPVPESEYDRCRHERIQWAGTRLKAMAALDDAPDALRDYAESSGLLGSADAVRLIADAYAAAGLTHEAMALLRENLNAEERFRSVGRGDRPPRIVDRLTEIADGACTRAELMELYTTLLLLMPNRSIRNDDLTHWYDELHRLADDAEWDAMRKKLLEEAPDTTANTCLAHEGSLEELCDRIMANGGSDLMRFEKLLSDAHPEPYVERYIKDAMSRMKWANDRRAYRNVAADLAHAAGLPGGQDRAQEAASSIRAEYPRRRALLDELRSAGFVM